VIDLWAAWHNQAMKTLGANLCLTLLAALTLGACDRTMELGKNDPDVPTGRACEVVGEAAMCGDDEELVAYCGYMEESATKEIGPCLVAEEVECEPGDWRHEPGPAGSDEFDPCSGTDYACDVVGGVPMWTEQECNTPLVLSFDASPIEMIAVESTPAATFDISMRADSCISTDWPTAVTPWLVVDLDGNGTIDGGHELFGSGSRLASGQHASNGFAALAELDADANEVVDGNDPRFGELMLWRDWDADRFSTPDELTRLIDSGVLSLPVEYDIDVSCDERGNCGVQRASFEHTAGVGEVVDVYLACH
jgi:hypothetical protein